MYTSTGTYNEKKTLLNFGVKSNHLSNVLSTVSDRKIQHENLSDPGTILYYTADIKSSQDYYAGGMLLPGRNFNSPNYKYGHNGQLKDDEISGSGNMYTAEYWEYDSRLIRRWNTDPIEKPWESPYACFNGNPIYFKDPSGLQGSGPDKPPTDAKPGDTWSHTDENGITWNYNYEKKGGWVGTGNTSGTAQLKEFSVKPEKGKSWLGKTLSNIGKTLSNIGKAIGDFFNPTGGSTLTSKDAVSSDAADRKGAYGDFINIDEFKMLLLRKWPYQGNMYNYVVKQAPLWAQGGMDAATIFNNLNKIARGIYGKDIIVSNPDKVTTANDIKNGVNKTNDNAHDTGDTTQCDYEGGCGQLHTTTKIDVSPPLGKKVSDYPKKQQ